MCIPGLMPKPPKMPSAPRPEDAFAAANRERMKRANASGYSSTILTSGLGDTSPSASQPKSILGG